MPKSTPLLERLQQLSPEDQEHLYEHFRTLLDDPLLLDITSHLRQIRDDPHNPNRTRINTLERINRFVRSAKQQDRFHKSGRTWFFSPILEKGYLVRVLFSGLGSEITDTHYGIVWDVELRRDHLLIIPCMSYKPETTKESATQFNIGPVGFLNSPDTLLSKSTVVHLDQIMPVSRKRILSHKSLLPNTRIEDIPMISRSQQQRIEEGFRVLFGRERTLYEAEIKNSLRRIPLFEDHDLQFDHLNRLYRVIHKTQDCLVYTLLNDPDNKFTLYLLPAACSEAQRKKRLHRWLNATGVFDKSSSPWLLVTPRTQVRQELYAHLLELVDDCDQQDS